MISQSALEREEGDCMVSAEGLKSKRGVSEASRKVTCSTLQDMSFKSEGSLLAELEHYL